MDSPPPPITSKFNLMQRTVQAVFGTREFAVVSLVAICAVVEAGILVATQRYEALTAPAGTVLFFGMSAAGMVIFFAEVLKLPVAWISGVVSGKRMIVLNIVTGLLCLLTTLTIKDLVIWEWDMALKPAREVRAQANALDIMIKALEDRRASLTEDSAEAARFRQTLIAQTEALIKEQTDRRQAERGMFQERLVELGKKLLSPAEQTELETLQTRRTSVESRFKQDVDGLEAHLKALNDQVGKELETIRASGSAAEAQKDKRRLEYEAARRAVNTEYDKKISKLGKDTWFSGVGPEKAKLESERERELSRLETAYKQDIATIDRASDTPSLKQLNRQIEEVRKQIAEKQGQRDNELKSVDTQIQELRAQASQANAAAEVDYDVQVARIETEREARMTEIQAKIKGYEEKLQALQTEDREQLSPQEVAVQKQEISERLPNLRSDRDKLYARSDELAANTNPIRAANGTVRWIMPDASTERLEQVAYGVFPLGIALLVSFMPAVLLEIAVYCVRPEIRRTERPRQNPFARLGRVRRTLSQLRTRAQERLTKADAALRECQLVRDNLALEHVNRTANLDREVEQKIELAMTDLHAKTDQLENELAQARSREAELGSKLSEVTSLAARAAEDVHKLTSHVVRLDAKVSQQR